jgi:hypothetical protein
MDAGWMSDIVTVYQMLVGPGTFLAGWEFVIVSRVTAGAPRTAGLAIPVTDVFFTKDTVASMRSRSVGHGS